MLILLRIVWKIDWRRTPFSYHINLKIKELVFGYWTAYERRILFMVCDGCLCRLNQEKLERQSNEFEYFSRRQRPDSLIWRTATDSSIKGAFYLRWPIGYACSLQWSPQTRKIHLSFFFLILWIFQSCAAFVLLFLLKIGKSKHYYKS